MAYLIAYSHERIENGCELESSVIVTDGGKEVCRFSVLGYADEAGRDEMAKARLDEFVKSSGYDSKAPAKAHPVMKASASVTQADLDAIKPMTDSEIQAKVMAGEIG